MKKERETLQKIEALPEPRHLFIFPDWADPATLDYLIREGYLTCHYQQRDAGGALQVIMGSQITSKGNRLLRPLVDWPDLVLKGSLAGASFTVMSFLILYLG